MTPSPIWHSWSRPALPVVVVAVLLSLGVSNIAAKVNWRPFEDGVFWKAGAQGVVADIIAADGQAKGSGLRVNDLLLAIEDLPVQRPADVVALLQQYDGQGSLRYTVLRAGSPLPIDLRIEPTRPPIEPLYFILAAVGVFALLVGGAVRLRRPSDPATLHFLWLAAAFCGVFVFSYTGRFDLFDWIYYWADVVAMLALPPLFLHFTMIFPDRPRRWAAGPIANAVVTATYAPAVLLGVIRVVSMAFGSKSPAFVVEVLRVVDKAEYVYLAACVIGGLFGLTRAQAQVCTITARRQLRWIAWGTALGGAPFALAYAIPHAFNIHLPVATELSVLPLSLIPLAFASAIVRYRLLDIEIIVKRSVIYAAALCAIALIYAGLLQGVDRFFSSGGAANQWSMALLATLVAVLLAPPVKTFVQTALDRAFYRDRYDYRRALVGFARDLNADLDLNRLADRLVSRVVETLLVDRMALSGIL